MARLENRVRKLEEADDRIGYTAAIWKLDEEDAAVFLAYMERWEAEGGERVPPPYPSSGEEGAMLHKLHDLRQQAIREGWGNSAYRRI